MVNKTRVVITGIGQICSIGDNPKNIWGAIKSGATKVSMNECAVNGNL